MRVTNYAEDQAEFEERIVDSSALAFRVAYAVLRHREDAEDVAQEVFLRAQRAFSSLRDRTRFRAWLTRMTWRLALDRQRSNRRRLRRDSTAAPTALAACPRPGGLSSDVEDRLRSAIDALPEKLRIVLVLAALEGYEVREVASLLGLPEGTVKSRLFLARKRLKETLPWDTRRTDVE